MVLRGLACAALAAAAFGACGGDAAAPPPKDPATENGGEADPEAVVSPRVAQASPRRIVELFRVRGGEVVRRPEPLIASKHRASLVHAWNQRWWTRPDACPGGGELQVPQGSNKAWCKRASDGALHGRYSEWYPNGSRALDGSMRDGEPDGIWYEWQEDGEIAFLFEFDRGQLLRTFVYDWQSPNRSR